MIFLGIDILLSYLISFPTYFFLIPLTLQKRQSFIPYIPFAFFFDFIVYQTYYYHLIIFFLYFLTAKVWFSKKNHWLLLILKSCTLLLVFQVAFYFILTKQLSLFPISIFTYLCYSILIVYCAKKNHQLI